MHIRTIILLAFVLTVCILPYAVEAQARRTDEQEFKTFTNSSSGLSVETQKKYVGFSLKYPSSWQISPRDMGKETNFVTLFRDRPGTPTYDEYLSIAGYTDTCPVINTAKLAELGDVAANLTRTLGAGYEGLKLGPHRRASVGKYDGVEVAFEGMTTVDGRQIPAWGKTILLPGVTFRDGTVYGLTLLMYATGSSPAVHSAADLGIRGELPAILSSLRLNLPGATNHFVPPAASIVRMEVGREVEKVDGEDRMLGTTTEFADPSRIASLLQVSNLKAGSRVTEVWIAEKPGAIPLLKDEYIGESDSPCGDKSTTTHQKTYDPPPEAGNYRYNVYIDGKLVRTLRFQLKARQ